MLDWLLPIAILGLAALAPAELPRIRKATPACLWLEGRDHPIARGEVVEGYTYMGSCSYRGKSAAVLEDFRTPTGEILICGPQGVLATLKKSMESTYADPKSLYRGHSLQEVLQSDHDLLGTEILRKGHDPAYAEVAACLSPIVQMETHTFVGTPNTFDKIGTQYGGRTANFDPAVFDPDIRACIQAKKVAHGLVGGWLPAVRFVYPTSATGWTEYVLYAPLRVDLDNPRIQPVWHRVCKVEGGKLLWVKYFDSYVPYPPRAQDDDAAGFFGELLKMKAGYEKTLEKGVRIQVPDLRIADQARHSLVRSMITRVQSFPKYGVLDRNYGGSEHDGFPDTFNVDLAAMLDWGLFGLARDYVENYLRHFVRDDGTILYRGPETGQSGRMLTELARYWQLTGDGKLLLQYRKRIQAIANNLLELRKEALGLPKSDPAYGLLRGWCEADNCLEIDPESYRVAYFSNSCEAARGFAELGRAWMALGLTKEGAKLSKEASALSRDIQVAIPKSVLTNTVPPSLPAVAGASEPFDVASQKRNSLDPQFRAYRTYMEMLYSGQLTRAQADMVIDYREAHRDVILGVPLVYGYNTGEMGGFLAYGHAYGLLRNDRIPEFLLMLYALSAHQYTRGSWTAPETRLIHPDRNAAPYCPPAQLTVPMLLRWALVWEDPNEDELWLGRAAPREWLEAGKRISIEVAPTRFGKVGFSLAASAGLISGEVNLPAGCAKAQVLLRLRLPVGQTVATVLVDGKAAEWDSAREAVMLPRGLVGRVPVHVTLLR